MIIIIIIIIILIITNYIPLKKKIQYTFKKNLKEIYIF